jgi:hypothetical protein
MTQYYKDPSPEQVKTAKYLRTFWYLYHLFFFSAYMLVLYMGYTYAFIWAKIAHSTTGDIKAASLIYPPTFWLLFLPLAYLLRRKSKKLLKPIPIRSYDPALHEIDVSEKPFNRVYPVKPPGIPKEERDEAQMYLYIAAVMLSCALFFFYRTPYNNVALLGLALALICIGFFVWESGSLHQRYHERFLLTDFFIHRPDLKNGHPYEVGVTMQFHEKDNTVFNRDRILSAVQHTLNLYFSKLDSIPDYETITKALQEGLVPEVKRLEFDTFRIYVQKVVDLDPKFKDPKAKEDPSHPGKILI